MMIRSKLGLVVLLVLLAAAPAVAQEFVCIPSCDPTDSRLLGVTPAGALSSLSPAKLDITIAVAGDRTSFEIGIFDGDSGVGTDHWDLGDALVEYRLFEDPDKDGVGPGETPLMVISSSTLANNDWDGAGPLPTSDTARAAGGNFFYTLQVELVTSFSGASALNAFKVRSSGPATIEIFQQPFAFVSNVTGTADGTIVFPNFPFARFPTTYDGSFSFFIASETYLDELNIWDGDLDFGSAGGARDTDDPNTPNDLTAAPFAGIPELGIPPFDTGIGATFLEGVACVAPSAPGPVPPAPSCRTGIGNPEEDRSAFFLVRPPAVTYTVFSPDGRSWHNANPSGNREWERFRVSTDPADCVPMPLEDPPLRADYCETELLPPGPYEIRVEGLDMQNLNFFFFSLPLRCVTPDGLPCEELREFVIGDTVFEDPDGNGVQDAGEPGIPGVIVEQVDENGAVVSRAITDADGMYLFGTDKGVWTVRVADENFSTDPPAGALGDRVWLDSNADGVQDAGEPGIPGVKVALISAGADGVIGGGDDLLLATAMTGFDGRYLFTGLAPGSYYTSVDSTTVPAGLSLSGGTSPSAVRTIVADDVFLDLDFGYSSPGSAVVGDFLWFDRDADGLQDPDEPGVGSGVSIDLIELGGDGMVGGGDDTLVATTTTRGGYYLFTGVAPGTYAVDVVDVAGKLAGLSLTIPGGDSNPDPTAPFAVAAGDVILTKDFGYTSAAPLWTISDVVWFDADRDAVLDGGEMGLAGVTVALLDGAGRIIASTTTAADGSFSFVGLRDGVYILEITDADGVLNGLLETTAPALAGGITVTVAGGDVLGINFGYVDEGALNGLQLTTAGNALTDEVIDANILTYDFGYRFGSIGDRVWLDLDGDGVQDAGEPGINGVTVELFDADGNLVATTVTTGDGDYTFDRLRAGTYTAAIDPASLPMGLAPTFDFDGIATPNTTSVPLAAGQDRDEIDFGYQVICGLTVDKTCQVVPQPGSFDCSDAKPLDLLSMIWSGGDTVRIKAWKGNVGSTLLADIDGITLGQEVSVSGYAGSPNDVIWEVFEAGSSNKLGQSKFHLSCSDSEMNGPEDCGKLQGDGKGNDSGLINLWMLEGLAGNGQTLDCTPTPPAPADECEAEQTPPASCDTLGDPTSLTFRYTGGSCADSMNEQGSKTECTGSVDGGALATVTTDDSDLTVMPSVVAPGGEFTVSGNFGSDFRLRLTNSSTQTNKIHTSCSAPLEVGDVYGAVTLTAFNGQVGGVLVTYNYAVANSGAALTGVTLVDDKLGPIAGPFDLPSGGNGLFSVDATLAETTVNEVLAVGSAFAGVQCAAGDTATVVLTEPCFECDGGTTDITFEYLGVGPASVVIYDDKDSKANEILFQGVVDTGDLIAVTKRPGQRKLDSNISLWVGGVEQAELHTSCSQPIGPGQFVGDFVIVEARSRNNGLMCPLEVCDAQGGETEIKDRELKWDITNGGELPLVIERISISWPAGNGKLDEIKREGDTIHKGDFAPDSAVIDSGWEGDEDKRTIEEGKTDTVKFKFKNDAAKGPYLVTIEFDQGCSVTLELDGTGPPGGSFDCSKPIDGLTMIWDGSQSVRIKAWKGNVGSTLLADVDGIAPSQEVSVSGFAGSPNDVIWEVFAAGTSSKLGQSKFHLSCSDSEMDGPEDCGKRQGNGKGNESGLINDWLLEGIVDSDETLDCTP